MKSILLILFTLIIRLGEAQIKSAFLKNGEFIKILPVKEGGYTNFYYYNDDLKIANSNRFEPFTKKLSKKDNLENKIFKIIKVKKTKFIYKKILVLQSGDKFVVLDYYDNLKFVALATNEDVKHKDVITQKVKETSFNYDITGLQPKYLVLRFDSISQKELFKISNNWIKETYVNPDEVLKMNIDNKKLRFNGSQKNAICLSILGTNPCYNASYSVSLSFKDNKIKFEPTTFKYYVPSTKYTQGGHVHVDFENGMQYFKQNGLIRNTSKLIPNEISSLFNSLSKSLDNYIRTYLIQEETIDEDW